MTWTNPTDKPICVNADKSAVVECDSVEAAFQLVGAHGELEDEVAAQYGLGTKARRPAEDKAVAPADDKAADAPTVPRRAR